MFWLVLTVRLLLATVWLWAAVAKIIALDQLTSMLKVLFPAIGNASIVVALFLICLEGFIGIGFLFRRSYELSAKLSLCAAIVFVAVNVVRAQAHIGVPCSCFGLLYKAGPVPMITLDLLLSVMSAALIRAGGLTHEPKNLVVS